MTTQRKTALQKKGMTKKQATTVARKIEHGKKRGNR